MTAINVIKQKGAIHLLSDGAGLQREGNLVARVNKVWPIPHLKAVFAGRGSPYFSIFIANYVSIAASCFDDINNILPEMAQTAAAEFKSMLERSAFGAVLDLFVVGWSEKNGPTGYFLCNHRGHGDVAMPWEVTELGGINLAPVSEPISADLKQGWPNGALPDDLDPVKDGLRMLEIQRTHPFDQNGDTDNPVMMRAVGAFAQLTTVTASAITTRIIHRWPDKIGDVIRP